MARDEASKPHNKPNEPPVVLMAYSIAAFCQAHCISPAFYFKLRQQGLGPEETLLGTRIIISNEAAARWRAAREAATAAERNKRDSAA